MARYAFIDETGSMGRGRYFQTLAAVTGNPSQIEHVLRATMQRHHLRGRFHSTNESAAVVEDYLRGLARLSDLGIFVVTVLRREQRALTPRHVILQNAAMAQLAAAIWKRYPNTALVIQQPYSAPRLQTELIGTIRQRLLQAGMQVPLEDIVLAQYSPALTAADAIAWARFQVQRGERRYGIWSGAR